MRVFYPSPFPDTGNDRPTLDMALAILFFVVATAAAAAFDQPALLGTSLSIVSDVVPRISFPDAQNDTSTAAISIVVRLRVRAPRPVELVYCHDFTGGAVRVSRSMASANDGESSYNVTLPANAAVLEAALGDGRFRCSILLQSQRVRHFAVRAGSDMAVEFYRDPDEGPSTTDTIRKFYRDTPSLLWFAVFDLVATVAVLVVVPTAVLCRLRRRRRRGG